ncbi:alkaline phosphatase D family protein [Streptomyces sp. NRRL S-87]|uniref:alkaline phosphatase D family protein n=1 Tax=Streptomyces sp. NRRL S-87 TaxID=1463920 RepID=UPI000AAF2B8C|nr:alkaline phosphatase D family protein [Streptomyces sp. NRRL S-87]
MPASNDRTDTGTGTGTTARPRPEAAAEPPVPTTTDVPTTDAPTLDVPTPDLPASDAPTLDVPILDAPTLDLPTPDVGTLDLPTPGANAPGLPALRLGPLLRHVDWATGTTATVWVETDRPGAVEVRCADGPATGTERTFTIAGHHYALIPVTGLRPGTTTAYEVLVEGHRVWPLPDSPFPPSTITTPRPAAPGRPAPPVRVTFGSCRQAAPPVADAPRPSPTPHARDHATPHPPAAPDHHQHHQHHEHNEHDEHRLQHLHRERAQGQGPHGPDALDALAARLVARPDAPRPDVLVLLGDQVYADQVTPATRAWLAARRDLGVPPGAQVADYEEFTHLYYESWLDPEVRWLLSTVPSCMIFDDHDLIDDWNTSATWLAEMRAAPWWRERVLSGLMSYWVHQHLGNLSPAELSADPLYAAVRAADDATAELRRFAARAESAPGDVRWSYRRDFGRTRLLMVDTRAGRVLDEHARAMIGPAELAWLRENALEGHGGYDHLLFGVSLPWLLPPLIHDAEAWDAALCRGVRGPRWARIGEDLRRRSDLEHWAAFPQSFTALGDLVEQVATGPRAPATVCVLSGDVHHSYVAEPRLATTSGVFQLTCSPVHNSVHRLVNLGFRFGWSRAGRSLGRMLSRHGRTGRPPLTWRRTGGPWFGNQLMTLVLEGRTAHLTLDRAAGTGRWRRRRPEGAARLTTVAQRWLAASGPDPEPLVPAQTQGTASRGPVPDTTGRPG